MRKYITLFLVLLLFLLPSVSVFGKSKTAINREIDTFEDKLKDASGDLETQETLIAQVDLQIQAKNAEIEKLNGEIGVLEKEISKKQSSIKETSKSHAANQAVALGQITDQYIAGDQQVEVVFTAGDLTEYDNNQEYFKVLEDLDKEKIAQLDNTRIQLETENKALEANKATLKSSKDALATEKASLDAEKAKLDSAKNEIEAIMADYNKEIDSLTSQLNSMVAASKATEKNYQEQINSYNPVIGSGQLQWPVPARGQSYISSTFRGPGRPNHTGIDIRSGGGQPGIVAAEAGVVTFAGSNGNYGECVIISHGNGLSTLYAHLSSYSVSVGNSVSKGASIGKMGRTGRVYGSAPGYGEHLHFEVRINGTPMNPMNYL